MRQGQRESRRAKESKGMTMTDWLKSNASIIWSWAALIAVAAIVFFASRGTQLAQFGIGLLTAAVTLLVAMVVFEVIWQAAMRWRGPPDDKAAPESTPRHRRRGQ
jgi:hypothetical protein